MKRVAAYVHDARRGHAGSGRGPKRIPAEGSATAGGWSRLSDADMGVIV